MLRYVLDTDIVICTVKNKPEKIKRAFVAHYGQICILTSP